MEKPQQNFNEGDYVFAKVRGYRYWPAKIETRKWVLSSHTFYYDVVFYATLETATCTGDKLILYSDDTRKLLSKTYNSHKQSEWYAEAVKLIKKDIREDGLSDAVVSETLDLPEKEIAGKEDDHRKRSAEVELHQQSKRLKVFYSKEQTQRYRKLARRFPPYEYSDKQQPQDQQQDDQHEIEQEQQQQEIETAVIPMEDVAETLDSPSLNESRPEDAMTFLQRNKIDLHEEIQKSVLSSDPEIVQVSKFSGNASDWNLNDQESEAFNQKAMEIQEIAKRFNKIVGRFKQIFPQVQQKSMIFSSKAIIQRDSNFFKGQSNVTTTNS